MILKDYYLGCLAHASYLVGDEMTGNAVVIDPQRDIGQYIADAKELGLTIRHALLTHFHADFLAGHIELREQVGAEIHVGAKGKAEFAVTPAADGDTIELGPLVRIGVLETPGHTPESVSFTVYDLEKDAENPHAVFTGDTLFIGEVGRPDLLGSLGFTAESLAGMLYDSLHEKLLRLPDETLVYPGHGAGSLCGKNLSTDTVSTIGKERRLNYALQPMSREEFVKMATANLPDAPAYFVYDAMLNRQERGTLDETLGKSLVPLPLQEVLRLQNGGAQVVDTRHEDEFHAGHLKDSTNIPLDGSYATWAGSLLDRDRPIVMVAPPGREMESVTRLGRIGYDHVIGLLEGGIGSAKGTPEVLSRTKRILPEELFAGGRANGTTRIIDVRNVGEREAGAIESSVCIPLREVAERMEEIPRDEEVVLYCRTGYRSSIAASILQRHGYRNILDLKGGIEACPTAEVGAQGAQDPSGSCRITKQSV